MLNQKGIEPSTKRRSKNNESDTKKHFLRMDFVV